MRRHVQLTFEFDQGSEGQIKPVRLSLMGKIKPHLEQFLEWVDKDMLMGAI